MSITPEKYNAAYINALSEERDPKILFEWIVKLHREKVDLLEEIKFMEREAREETQERAWEKDIWHGD